MYMKVLREKLFPCHMSMLSMALLEEQFFSMIDCPGNSLVHSPIENIWSIIMAKLKRDHSITSCSSWREPSDDVDQGPPPVVLQQAGIQHYSQDEAVPGG
jgi:hypothetical protein